MNTPRTTRAFTLAELIVAIVITALLAGVTTTIVSNIIASRDAARSLEMSMRRAQHAVDAIASDLPSIVRSGDLFFTRLQIISSGVTPADRDELLFISR